MPLRLSPELQAIYDDAHRMLDQRKQAAVQAGDKRAAKRVRQEITKLYQRFVPLQLPPPEPTVFERRELQEARMTLEDRIERIEQVLKLGKFADGFYDDFEQ